jgi:hypothetical protein
MDKHIIWSNLNLDIDDWRDGYKEWLEINEIDDRDPDNEDDIYNWMVETNSEYLGDEQMNLDKVVDGRILVIADLGLWDGRKSGYKILDTNIKKIFDIGGFDYAEFFGDGKDIRAKEIHHDGTNYYLYRVIREDRDIDKLLDAIYDGEEISSQKLNYYTRSLYKDVADVYGWR